MAKKFEEVKHGTFTADIKLDKDTGKFSCKYGNDEFESHSLPEVRTWAKGRLRALSSLDWKAIMKVTTNSSDSRVNNLDHCSDLSCYIERFWIAWDGVRWVQAPWVVMPPGNHLCSPHNESNLDQKNYPMSETELMQQRIYRSRHFYEAEGIGETLRFPFSKSHGNSDVTHFVPYTDLTWQTMVGVMERMRELRNRINTLLATSGGWKELASIANVKLLSDGQPKEEHGAD